MPKNFYTPITTKPAFEKIQPSFGSSISFKRFTDEQPNGIAAWHYHPEIELVYIAHGNGKRHIGNHVSYYTNGDLILIGSDVPHYGFTDRMTDGNTEVVLQFKKDFLGNALGRVTELEKVNQLLDLSLHGLSFSGVTKRKVGQLLDEMVVMSHFDKLLHTMRILQIMSKSEEYQILNASKATIEINQQDKDRIKVIYDFVRQNFQRDISLMEISELTNMTIPSFCRYFKKQTGKTFTQFVNEFKVIDACKLLSETGRTIADICFECGFNNFSHFNKQFKIVTGKSPSEYRSEFKRVIS